MTVAFAVNTSICAGWSWIYRYLIDLGQQNRGELTSRTVPRAMYIRERDRGRVDEFTRWFARFTRVLSFVMAVAIGGTLLFLRATTTLYFACVALVGVTSPLLVSLAVIIHHYRMYGIAKREKEIHDVVEENAKILLMNLATEIEAHPHQGIDGDEVDSLPRSQSREDRGFFFWTTYWGSIILATAIVGTLLTCCLWFHRPLPREAACSPQCGRHATSDAIMSKPGVWPTVP